MLPSPSIPPSPSPHQSNTPQQCPVPDAQLGRKGSLGLKRRYAGATDLLSSFTRKIFLTQQGGDALAAGLDPNAPQHETDLILYDPDQDELYQSKLEATRAAAAAAEAASEEARVAEDAFAAAAGDGEAAATVDVEEIALSGKVATQGVAAGAAVGAGAAAAAADQGAPRLKAAAALLSDSSDSGGSSSSSDEDESTQGHCSVEAAPAAAVGAKAPTADVAAAAAPAPACAATLKAAASQARAAAVAAAAAAATAVRDAGPPRAKVHAEAFLVSSLRPHQREGVKFVFTRLCGTLKDGVSGAVLADGMGLGKTFQTVGWLLCWVFVLVGQVEPSSSLLHCVTALPRALPSQVASLWCLLTKGIHAGQGATCKRPLVLCPSSLVQNWGKVSWSAADCSGWEGSQLAVASKTHLPLSINSTASGVCALAGRQGAAGGGG
jgi:hypothetical protein